MATKNKNARDEFSAMVYQTVTESAANTLTFGQIQTGYGSLQKTAWIIHRIEWYIAAASLNLATVADDIIQVALTTSNLLSSLTLQDSSLIDLYQHQIIYYTSVGQLRTPMPEIRSFSDLPGGGRLVLPYPLYIAVKGTSLASAVTAACRITFTERDLSDSEWMDLVQQTRLLA